MRITAGEFLVSYMLYLLVSICYIWIKKEDDIVQVMVNAVTITGALFSLSDIFFTLSEAHKNNMQIFGEYKKMKNEDIQNYQILEKDYGEQEREMVEDMTEEELDAYLNENSKLCQEVRNAESIDKKLSAFEKERRKKEKAYQKCSSIILIVALFVLLVITTFRIHFSEKQTNIFTVSAFFLVIFNLYMGIQYKEKLDLLYQELEDCNKHSIK